MQETAHRPPAPPTTVFAPRCTTPTYPSPAPQTAPLIDSECGLSGSGGEEAIQNIAKNNFCASGAATDMTIDDFAKLQQKVNDDPSIPFGNSSQGGRPKGPARDRTPLQALGEGNLVRIQAFVSLAKPEGSESVNCEKNVPDQAAFHDIHIELTPAPASGEDCGGIVVEMTPHHRPDSWTPENVAATKKHKLPVRVTGQLFFDSSHFPCENGSAGGNPKRVSLWEIHPVYAFEVCPKGNCSSDADWIPLDQYISTEPNKNPADVSGPPTSRP
jgi:hypothetical protein